MPKKEKTHVTSHSSTALEEKLIHNMVELQKVHADLAEKVGKLTHQIGELLVLFESAAHSFAKQTNLPGLDKDKEFLDKIDKLLDQNKTIAKGLTLVEEKIRERVYGTPTSQNFPPQRQDMSPRPLPRF